MKWIVRLQLPFRSSHAGMFPKKNSSSEVAIKMHFSISLSAPLVKFLEKYLRRWSAIFSKFACKAVLLWTTTAEKLYFITVLINALKSILLRNISTKMLLCLEAVVRRCFSKQVFLKILQISQENTCVWVCFLKETPTQALSCEICERLFLQNTFL